MTDVKQVIIIRTKYPDGKGGTVGCRAGKLIAQGSHASMAFMSNLLLNCLWENKVPEVNQPIKEWLMGSFAKVVLQIGDDETLLKEIAKAGEDAGIATYLITDSGFTEFHGVPTLTALALGPDYSEKIDEITGPNGKFNLKLY